MSFNNILYLNIEERKLKLKKVKALNIIEVKSVKFQKNFNIYPGVAQFG